MDIAVIGLGLIGGSLTRALAARGHRVSGYDLDPSARGLARTASAQSPTGERWQTVTAIREAVSGCSLCVIAVPLPAVGGVLDELANCGFTGLITDTTSVKVPVRRLAEERLRDRGQRLAGYIGGHPMAGKELTGFSATDPRLFQGSAWALCLEPETSLPDWLGLAGLIISLGARVVPTTAAIHDEAVATISHLPHLLAAALATAITDPFASTLAAGSFRDATRVAATPAHLIGAMCGGNAEPLARALDDLMDSLTDARNALDGRNPVPAVTSWAQPGHQARTRWPRGWGAPFVVDATIGSLLDLGADGGWITDVHPDGRAVTAVRPV